MVTMSEGASRESWHVCGLIEQAVGTSLRYGFSAIEDEMGLKVNWSGMEPAQFELLCAALLQAVGCQNVRMRHGGGDGGWDIDAEWPHEMPGGLCAGPGCTKRELKQDEGNHQSWLPLTRIFRPGSASTQSKSFPASAGFPAHEMSPGTSTRSSSVTKTILWFV